MYIGQTGDALNCRFNIDQIFCVTLTDVNFQNIFVMVIVILKQTYLCLSWKKLKDLNIYENLKINGLYVGILFTLVVQTCTSQTFDYYICHCLNNFGVVLHCKIHVCFDLIHVCSDLTFLL